MFLLVAKFKIIGMQMNFVHGQVQKSQQKRIAKESYGLITIPLLISNNYGMNK